MRDSARWWIRAAVGAALVLWWPAAAGAQALPRIPCDDLLPPLREVKGKKVGPQSCLMIEQAITVSGRAIKRIDIGLDGTVDGYVTKTGDYRGYLTNVPHFVFPQTADPGPVFLAFATYEMKQGAGMTVFLPADRQAWNGKLFVMVHGAGPGVDRSWDRGLDGAKPEGPSRYEIALVERGYAVARTRRTANAVALARNANPPPTGIKTVLEDGTEFEYAAFNDTAHYVKDFTLVAEKLVQGRLGQDPSRTYFYGHSAGARIGRGMNYTKGLNRRSDGTPFFDAFVVDDSGAGGWLPVVMKDGKDVQFATEVDKAEFVPQLEIGHLLYGNIWPPKKPDWVSSSYLENKRTNAKLLREKGLGPKFRFYEVRGISHNGVGGGIDLAWMMDRFVDTMDAWVEKGTEPPPSRSDWGELGDRNGDGVIEFPALTFPEVACPLGVYYPTMSTSGSTAFAPFTGQGLEPLDENKVFVDMNRNGSWDYRETPTQAWRRLGLLKPGEQLTRDKYVACIQSAAAQLEKEGFYSPQTAKAALDRARKADLQPKEAPPTQQN
jgi:hypothetical protein